MEILTCFSCRLSLFTIMTWQSVKKGGKGKDHLLVFLCVPVLAGVLGRKLDCLLAGFLQSEFFLTGSCFKTNRKILFAVSWSSIACIISNLPVSGSYTSQLWKKTCLTWHCRLFKKSAYIILNCMLASKNAVYSRLFSLLSNCFLTLKICDPRCDWEWF